MPQSTPQIDTEDLESLRSDDSISTVNSEAHEHQQRPRSLHHIQSRVEGHEQIQPLASRVSTLRDKSLMVPRKKRRGLLSQFSLIPEYKDPRDYPSILKKFIVLLIAYASMMGPMGTSIVFPAIGLITSDYNTSTIMVNVSVGIYLISLGVFPLWWSSISELKGRRTVYLVSFTLLFAFCIGTAVSPNIQAFIILRVLCGASSASVQSVGAGTIADLYAPEERGKNLGYFYLGALTAPLLSPIIGSLLVNHWSWRSTQWFMVILAGANVILIVLFLPETLRLQENKSAIAAILAERRNANKQSDGEDTDGKGQEEKPESLARIENDENSDEEDSRIERMMTYTSEVPNYIVENYLDPGAPQISKIQSHDPKLEQRVRENDLKKLKTNLENEIERIETRKSGKSNTNHNQQSNKKGKEEEKEEEEKEKDKQSWKKTLYIYLIRPLKSLHFLRYPAVSLAISFSAISFAALYFVNITIEYRYSRPPYNFKPLYIGLLYIPNSVTYIFASIYGGRWVDNLLKSYKEKHGILAPEARISWNVVTAVICFPISLLIFGWCLDKKEHWVTPLVGTALFGFASMMTIGATVSYLVDSLPGRGATGVALNNLIRQIFAATAVFVTEPMLEGMGTGWAFTMLAFVVLGGSSVLIVLKRKGDYWRENYDLQKLYDLIE